MIEPYRLRPVPPTVALLDEQGDRILDEHSDWRPLAAAPAGFRVWASWDTVSSLLAAGRGEAFCWDGEPIRWRPTVTVGPWRNQPTDVIVIRSSFPADPREAVRGLRRWRDWLASYGASPVSTTGSAAWSLLRATLEQPLWLAGHQIPPLRFTVGGRQQLGVRGAGAFRGDLQHFDLQAAYARTLGGLRYGGRWFRVDNDPRLERWARFGPVFARAIVQVPELLFGPLLRRPRRLQRGWRAFLAGQQYPTGRRVQGVWSAAELEQAELQGCRILRLGPVWVHLAGSWQPFEPWLEAVERGRRLQGFAASLAKLTGNALWGRFCTSEGARHGTLRFVDGRRVFVQAPARGLPFWNRDVALAELVAGSIRARLGALIQSAGPRLISAHTDGAWLEQASGFRPPDRQWRRKGQATRLDVLGPQCLRYWPGFEGEPVHVVSGVPPARAAETFEQLWAEHELAGLAW